jgi:hypothetical protein
MLPQSPRLVCLSSGSASLRAQLAALQHYFVDGRWDGVCLIVGPEWTEVPYCPFPMRHYEEYSLTSQPLEAARRVLLEEHPQLLLTDPKDRTWEPLQKLVQQLGIAWNAQPHSPKPGGFALPKVDPSLGPLSRAANPDQALLSLLSGASRLDFEEPVNVAFEGHQQRFHYGLYNNEFALQPPTCDLKGLLSRHLKREQFQVSLVGARCGQAGLAEELEANDGKLPRFRVQVDLNGVAQNDSWPGRFSDGDSAQLRLLFFDLHNIGGSGMQHAAAINRYSQSRARVICREPHPFMPASGDPLYTATGWSDEIRHELEKADVLVFLEDDSAHTLNWPEAFRKIALAKPTLYFYVGFRVHRQVAQRQRPNALVLSGLPHVLRMYPEARFYPGFYPTVLDDLELREPRSQRDGILRVLHTPSLPSAVSHRLSYHKDTDAFLRAAQLLKKQFPQVEFWQLAGVPNAQVLQARLDCDIAFHQLRGFAGMSGNEAMFLRRPTIQSFDQENINRHLEHWGLDTVFPFVHATRENLPEVIEGLLVDADRREEVGQHGRTFQLQYMSAQRGIATLLHYALEAVERGFST